LPLFVDSILIFYQHRCILTKNCLNDLLNTVKKNSRFSACVQACCINNCFLNDVSNDFKNIRILSGRVEEFNINLLVLVTLFIDALQVNNTIAKSVLTFTVVMGFIIAFVSQKSICKNHNRYRFDIMRKRPIFVYGILCWIVVMIINYNVILINNNHFILNGFSIGAEWYTAIGTLVLAFATYLMVRESKKVSAISRDNIKITKNVIVEQRFVKEMDLIGLLFSNKLKWEVYEPLHVDQNDEKKEKEASEFWKEIKKNRYIAPNDLRNLINKYLKIIESSSDEVQRMRHSISKSIRENIGDIDPNFQEFLRNQLGERGFIKPLPLEESLNAEHKSNWTEFQKYLNSTQPGSILSSQTNEYISILNKNIFDIRINQQIEKLDLSSIRNDFRKAIEARYDELERDIDELRSTFS